MKIIFLCLFFAILFLGCSTTKQIVMWGDCTPFTYPSPFYKGQVTIAFCKITTIDSLNVENLDSLASKIKYQNNDERSRIEFGVTIFFKLDSTRIARDIRFYNSSHEDFGESILKGLTNFKFKFNKQN